MKNFPYLIYALLLALLLPACSNEKKEFLIGVSQCSDDAWRRQMNGEILRETFMYGNVDVEFRAANDDSRKQIEDIKYFINKKVDLIVVAPNEAAALTPIIERAYDLGIPVVVVDRKILSDKYTAFIGGDNFEIGKSVGNYIKSKWGEAKSEINIVELSGLSNSTPAQERSNGFAESVKKQKGINMLCVTDAGWLKNVAFSKMDSILRAYPKIDVVFAQNDMMAIGAYEAAKQYHREKEIAFIGIDAIAGDGLGLEAVHDKILTASFTYPTGGDKVLQTCMNILEKRHFHKTLTLNTTIVDSVNVEGMLLQTAQISELDQKIETLNGKITNYISIYYTQKIVLFCILAILLLIVIVLILAFKALKIKNRLNAKLSEQKSQIESQYEQMVRLSKELEDATQAKLVFFTNISHDFRTPLTLVADPVDQLLASPDIKGHERKLIELIKKNTGILLRLVNQILDFRKYENGKMDYVAEPLDLRKCFSTWNGSFTTSIVKKHIHFTFDADPSCDFVTKADRTKMESIYFNLLSNAFKYTPENGNVTVKMTETGGANPHIKFTVANTGSYIEPQHISKIFDRFYKTDLHHTGSGIGLALVKAFVDMHGGTITVDSTQSGGTIFTVEIPKLECGSSSQLPIPVSIDNKQAENEILEEERHDTTPDSSKQLVLVIDDNADIRTYIASILGETYSIIEAANGTEGIRKAMKYVPDIIICDVMMPGIDGIECCKRLKQEIQTCHIPVMLLTACSLDEQRIQGYACGADSYIAKPFSSELLRARVANLILSRSRQKQYFGDNSALVKEDICDIDKDFVTQFKNLVEKHISNSDLSVEEIGREMGMSRVQLYRKLKSLTNYSPNELIRITRLKKAHSIISSQDKSISEVAYEVGFTSPSYFAKCYKDYFGESPTAIRSRPTKN